MHTGMKGVYAILDTLAGEIIGGLHVYRAEAAAIRFFSDIALDQKTHVAQHVTDYDLVRLGYLDNDSNALVGDPAPVVVISGAAWSAAQQPKLEAVG